jgi:hypothetical protein
MRKYPNNTTFAWERSDGDYEIGDTVNGETIENDILRELLVAQTLITLRRPRPLLHEQATTIGDEEQD